jgi:hypothetical protein
MIIKYREQAKLLMHNKADSIFYKIILFNEYA